MVVRFPHVEGRGGYDARSPIAVRGAAIDAPAEISGTGVSGTASFDVKFGYTGAYTAVPQGLVARGRDRRRHQPGSRSDLSRARDDGGGVDRIPFDLTGAAFARLELVIPGAPDIDLYCSIPPGTSWPPSTAVEPTS